MSESMELLTRIAKAAGCLPSCYADGNEHIIEAIETMKAELDKLRWIPVNLGPPYDSRPKESGKVLVLTKDKMIFEVYITVGEDEFEQDGVPCMLPVHKCYLPNIGCVLLGEDDCITHWMPIPTLPKQEADK